MKLKVSNSLLFSRGNVGTSGSTMGRCKLSVPIGLGCGVNLKDLLKVCLTTNPSFCFSFGNGRGNCSGEHTVMNIGMNTNLGLIGRLRVNFGCGVPLKGSNSMA